MDSVFNLEFQNQHLDGKITAGLEKLSSVFRILLWEQAKQIGLSPIQIQILIFLKYHRSEFLTVSYIAKEFGLTKATISDAIRILEQKTLIIKQRTSLDNRSFSLILTSTGNAMVADTENFANQIQSIISNINQVDKEALWKTIFQLIFQLNQSDVITVQRMCFTCRHYEGKEGTHFCKLLHIPLPAVNLRIDCPEHNL